MRRFAISDIHGCAKTFKRLVEKLDFSTADELYLLGDYVDRGPDSKGVIDYIWALQESGHTVYTLKGNHEEMMINALERPDQYPFWFRQGGRETLQSFGTPDIHQIDAAYWRFLKNLSYYVEVEKYLLVHAGFNFTKPDPLEDQKAMLWIRQWYGQIDKAWLDGRVVVHGHTPSTQMLIKALNAGLHIDTLPVLVIDNGCVYDRPEMGHLCAFELGEQKLFFEPKID